MWLSVCTLSPRRAVGGRLWAVGGGCGLWEEAAGCRAGGRLNERAAPKAGPFLFLVEAHFKHKP